ncbi:MAG: ATP-dependent helicase [Alphaproteobacteria bacterium]|nr:ATP-dependent helicase [Alphaproteobacteria bacterium]
MDYPAYLRNLNVAQRKAVEHGVSDGRDVEVSGPLLIIAGAGTGKTNTLAHRVVHLILNGAAPERILLLTFTRRAATEMTRRAQRILAAAGPAQRPSVKAASGGISWSGTFHAIANRLLREHAHSIGLDPSFTVLDRGDAADRLNFVRNELGLAKTEARFPRKDTCLAIYSHTVNARSPLSETLESAFPWCAAWEAELKSLFRAYVEAKQQENVLDYDDLLLYWALMMEDPALAQFVSDHFDHILVDEYQDTNALQARILLRMKPDGRGLTVVGDDAQSIYSFRAATVRNILDFPNHFAPPAEVVTLEQNYRSTEPILDACNAVIGQAAEGFRKQLVSDKLSGERPQLVVAADERAQVEYVVERVLEHREAGIDLKRQAVLFRTSHHSDQLELELARRGIPFVKYGGLRFLETVHVRDLLCVLRWIENPRDAIAAFRVLQLLPGLGPAMARAALIHLTRAGWDFASLNYFPAPGAAAPHWPEFCGLLSGLRKETAWEGQIALVRQWYQPHLERLHDNFAARSGDLDQLEQIAATYPTRGSFLSELTLDPPEATGAEAMPPHLDEDYLILSTIHSAKGQEWSAVFVLNVIDGCIPSDMAVRTREQVEEERRLLYVAMTRARQHLHLIQPMRLFRSHQHRHGDGYVLTMRSRFIPDSILDTFERRAHADAGYQPVQATGPRIRVDLAARMREMWE